MKEIILAKYGEIALKGDNRRTFEDILVKNIKRRLSSLGKFSCDRRQSTIYIEPTSEDFDIDAAVDEVKKIFGISAIQRCAVFPKDFGAVVENLGYLDEALSNAKTFKVEAKRSDKAFPMKSPDI